MFRTIKFIQATISAILTRCPHPRFRYHVQSNSLFSTTRTRPSHISLTVSSIGTMLVAHTNAGRKRRNDDCRLTKAFDAVQKNTCEEFPLGRGIPGVTVLMVGGTARPADVNSRRAGCLKRTTRRCRRGDLDDAWHSRSRFPLHSNS